MSATRKEILSEFFSDENTEVYKPSVYAKYGYVFLLLGILIVFLSLADYIGNYFLLGLSFFILGMVLVRKKLNELFSFGVSNISDADTINEMFISDTDETILKRAFEISGIQEKQISEETVFKIYVPVFKTDSETEIDYLRTQLDDETYVYSHWHIHILIAANNYLSYYSCFYDWTENECDNELSNEFYYFDIASIKSELTEIKSALSDEDSSEKKYLKKFVISNVSGDKIEFVSEKPALKLNDDFRTDTEDLVKNIRHIIRKKRFPDDESYSEEDIDFEIEDTTNKDNNE